MADQSMLALGAAHAGTSTQLGSGASWRVVRRAMGLVDAAPSGQPFLCDAVPCLLVRGEVVADESTRGDRCRPTASSSCAPAASSSPARLIGTPLRRKTEEAD